MPFSIDIDGPYFSVSDFFGRLSRLSRIFTVGDLTFNGLGGGPTKYPVRPNTTIGGSCVVTTFFTAPSDVKTTAAPAVQPAVAAKPAAASARAK